MPTKAFDRYEEALSMPKAVLGAHDAAQSGKGRRWFGPAVNGAAVVLAVGAWQLYVEELTKEALEVIAAAHPRPHGAEVRLLRQQVGKAVGSFSTPNQEKTEGLLGLTTIDLAPVFRQKHPDHGTRTYGLVLNSWLKVRHTIAHGSKFRTGDAFAYLLTGSSGGHPTIRKGDAEGCLKTLSELVKMIDRYCEWEMATIS